jgi:hypothetical protein
VAVNQVARTGIVTAGRSGNPQINADEAWRSPRFQSGNLMPLGAFADRQIFATSFSSV